MSFEFRVQLEALPFFHLFHQGQERILLKLMGRKAVDYQQRLSAAIALVCFGFLPMWWLAAIKIRKRSVGQAPLED